MKILAIDTSGAAASCALLDDERPISEFYTYAKLTHSQTIMPMVEALLECSHSKIEDVDLFAVAVGPGSFTGLRIGISAIKGMSQVLNKPCSAVSTLEGLAYNLHDRSGIACAVMDARCGQVYTALFDLDQQVNRISPDDAIPITELIDKLAEIGRPITLVGDAIQLVSSAFIEKFPNHTPLLYPSAIMQMQKAYSVGLCAYTIKKSGQEPITAAELVPAYLKLPQAQRELLAKQQSKSL